MDPAARKVAHALDMEAVKEARDLVEAHVRLYATIFDAIQTHPVLARLDMEILKDIASTIYIQTNRRNGR